MKASKFAAFATASNCLNESIAPLISILLKSKLILLTVLFTSVSTFFVVLFIVCD